MATHAPFPAPQYRIELRHPDKHVQTISYGDTLHVVELNLDWKRRCLECEHAQGDLVIVAQENDEDVLCVSIA